MRPFVAHTHTRSLNDLDEMPKKSDITSAQKVLENLVTSHGFTVKFSDGIKPDGSHTSFVCINCEPPVLTQGIGVCVDDARQDSLQQALQAFLQQQAVLIAQRTMNGSSGSSISSHAPRFGGHQPKSPPAFQQPLQADLWPVKRYISQRECAFDCCHDEGLRCQER